VAPMDRKKVSSSLLRAVGYDPREQCLEVEFNDGRITQFLRVPSEVHRRLMSAPSIVSYFRDQIEDEYSRRTVR